MLVQMVMEGRRFATLVCEDLTTEYNCSTASPEQDLLVECAGLKVSMWGAAALTTAWPFAGSGPSAVHSPLQLQRCQLNPQPSTLDPNP